MNSFMDGLTWFTVSGILFYLLIIWGLISYGKYKDEEFDHIFAAWMNPGANEDEECAEDISADSWSTGYDEGFEDGYAAGLEDGFADGKYKGATETELRILKEQKFSLPKRKKYDLVLRKEGEAVCP